MPGDGTFFRRGGDGNVWRRIAETSAQGGDAFLQLTLDGERQGGRCWKRAVVLQMRFGSAPIGIVLALRRERLPTCNRNWESRQIGVLPETNPQFIIARICQRIIHAAAARVPEGAPPHRS